MYISHPRMLAGLLSLVLALSPVTVFAHSKQPIDDAVPAVTALSPISQEADPSQTYLTVARRLKAMGLDQGQIRTLWARLGSQLSALLESGALTAQTAEYLLLPNCAPALLDRCLAYGQAHPELSYQDVVTAVTIGLDRPFFTGVEVIQSPADPLVLVNKYHALPANYVPQLTPLESRYGSGSLTPEAAAAFVRMADAARADGISLRSVSAYRSYSTQQSLYNRYVSQSGSAAADTFSARAGYSEHQTGLALDINVARTSAHFENTKEYDWLVEHCAQFGFLLRYPQDKSAVTGYRFEPWHYRYVGTEVAQVCMAQGLTFEEYLAQQPLPNTNQVPDLYYQGQSLELEQGTLLLEGICYLSTARLAEAAGWSVQGDVQRLLLSSGASRLTLTPGRRCVRDGQPGFLIHPALSLEGDLYLSLEDLCSLLRFTASTTQRGIQLTPLPTPSAIAVRG